MQLKKILSILNLKYFDFSSIVFFILLLSILEFFSIALILPIISFLLEETSATSNVYMNFLDKFDILKNFNYLLLILLFLYILKTFYIIFLNNKIFLFVYNLQARLRVRLARDFYSKELYNQKIIKTSNYINFINNHSSTISGTALFSYIKIFSDILILFTLSLLIFLTEPIIFVIIILCLGFFYFTYYLFSRKLFKKYGEKTTQIQGRLIHFVEYIVNSFKEIALSSKHNFFINRVNLGSREYAKNYSNFLVLGIIPKYLIELIIVFGIVILSYKTKSNGTSIQISSIAIITAATIKMYPLFNSLINSINKIKFSSYQVDEIYNLFEINNKISNNPAIGEAEFIDCEIKNLSFKLNNKLILKNINLKFKKGDIIAIRGSSGSGKTTLLDIILGYKSNYSGVILINGQKANNFNLRSKVYYINQDAKLFNDTLEKNITLEEKTSDTKKLSKIVADFNLNNFMGLDVIVNESSNNLSGGQIQKILLARCFYHDRSIVILDESTSAVDTHSEENISRIISLNKDKTFIIIGHRSNLLELSNVSLDLKIN